MDYSKYLKSAAWDNRRKAAVKRSRQRCALCNRQLALEVHHRTYKRLGDEIASDVIALCRRCHSLFHDHYKYNKRRGIFQPKK